MDERAGYHGLELLMRCGPFCLMFTQSYTNGRAVLFRYRIAHFTTMSAIDFFIKGLAMNRSLSFAVCVVITVAAAMLAGCQNVATTEDGLPVVKHMIDTHIHLYDTTRPEGVPWPYPDNKVLYKPHMPAEFNRVAKPAHVTGVVIVEASHHLEDNRWILDLVKDDSFYVGLVGNVDLYSETFATDLAALAKDPRYVGIRARRKGDLNFADAIVVKNLRELAKQNLTLDMLINGKGPEGVAQVDQVATQVPELTIVANHVFGYNIDGTKPNAEWVAVIKRVSRHRNVYCKVSGLYQRCRPQPASKDIEHYRGLLDVLWQNFGADRLVYGSNWPCTKESGDYASFVRLVTTYFADKGQAACENYFWRNAARAYRLPLK